MSGGNSKRGEAGQPERHPTARCPVLNVSVGDESAGPEPPDHLSVALNLNVTLPEMFYLHVKRAVSIHTLHLEI